jgi:hypothetical protein
MNLFQRFLPLFIGFFITLSSTQAMNEFNENVSEKVSKAFLSKINELYKTVRTENDPKEIDSNFKNFLSNLIENYYDYLQEEIKNSFNDDPQELKTSLELFEKIPSYLAAFKPIPSEKEGRVHWFKNLWSGTLNAEDETKFSETVINIWNSNSFETLRDLHIYRVPSGFPIDGLKTLLVLHKFFKDTGVVQGIADQHVTTLEKLITALETQKNSSRLTNPEQKKSSTSSPSPSTSREETKTEPKNKSTPEKKPLPVIPENPVRRETTNNPHTQTPINSGTVSNPVFSGIVESVTNQRNNPLFTSQTHHSTNTLSPKRKTPKVSKVSAEEEDYTLPLTPQQKRKIENKKRKIQGKGGEGVATLYQRGFDPKIIKS